MLYAPTLPTGVRKWFIEQAHLRGVMVILDVVYNHFGLTEISSQKLERALAEDFAFQGEIMRARNSARGSPSAELPPGAFIAFMQNHDQIGDRAFGERINAIASQEAVHAIAAIYLLLPQTPMLFMGEEWGSSQPFPFFFDFEGELGELVRNGRREEFANFPEFQDPKQRERIPDPQAIETFSAAKLDSQQMKEEVHSQWFHWYRTIPKVRRELIVPHVAQMTGDGGTYEVLGVGAVVVRFWNSRRDRQLMLAANLSDNSTDGFPEVSGQTVRPLENAGMVTGDLAPPTAFAHPHCCTEVWAPGHQSRKAKLQVSG